MSAIPDESCELPVSDAHDPLAEVADAEVRALSREFAAQHRELLDRLANL